MKIFVHLLITTSTLCAFLLSMLLILKTQTAIFLTSAVLVHELGHFLVMYCLGYTGLKIIFIPFLGAAVINKPSPKPVWKDTAMLLAGPIPGILIGIVCLLFWDGDQSSWLLNAGFTFAVINLLNLLPFEPMDGGKLFKLHVYERFRTLEAGSLFASLGFFAYLFDMHTSVVGWCSFVFYGSFVSLFVIMRWGLRTMSDRLEWLKVTEGNSLTEEQLTLVEESLKTSGWNNLLKKEDIVERIFKPRAALFDTVVFVASYIAVAAICHYTIQTTDLVNWNFENARDFLKSQARFL